MMQKQPSANDGSFCNFSTTGCHFGTGTPRLLAILSNSVREPAPIFYHVTADFRLTADIFVRRPLGFSLRLPLPSNRPIPGVARALESL